MQKYSGSEWMESQHIEMSDFGKEVADILGQTFLGIYHIHDCVINKKVNWKDDRWIAVSIRGGMETFDFDILTRLVVLCFDRMVRLEINPKTFTHLQLVFTRRCARDGSMSSRLPFLEDHVQLIRDNIGLGIIEG